MATIIIPIGFYSTIISVWRWVYGRKQDLVTSVSLAGKTRASPFAEKGIALIFLF